MAGIVVGVIALPLSMALAVAVGAPPIAGLYTAAFAGATASIFGGSRFNITGPTAALVPLLSHVVLQHGFDALPMVGVMAGVLLLVMYYFKVGRLIRFMPGTVIVGFTAGIAISIAFGQLNNILGLTGTDPKLEHFHEKLIDTIGQIGTLDATTLAVGLIALFTLFAWVRTPFARILPGPLLVVVALTAITWGLDIETTTLGSRYGDLPTDIPTPSLSFFDAGLIVDLLPSAFAIAVLSSVESLLSAVVADGMARTTQKHDPDREILGQGLANLVSPIMGGIPATAAIARTAAGVRSGGNSRLVGVVHSITVLSATLLLGSLAGNVPISVLAAILIFTAWNIADVPELKALITKAPRMDVVVLLMTVVITVVLDLTYAIGFGIIASAFLLIHQLMKLPAAKELVADENGRVTEVSAELSALMQARPDISFFTAQGMLSFHSVATFEYELNVDLSKPLILRMKDVHHIDTSGLMTLKGVIEHRQRHGSRIMLSAIQPELLPVLERFGIIELIGRENVFPESRLAIASVEAPREELVAT
ncbi:MAG: SulP family inorganic anion transporter [Dehalococcoidia bacterium]